MPLLCCIHCTTVMMMCCTESNQMVLSSLCSPRSHLSLWNDEGSGLRESSLSLPGSPKAPSSAEGTQSWPDLHHRVPVFHPISCWGRTLDHTVAASPACVWSCLLLLLTGAPKWALCLVYPFAMWGMTTAPRYAHLAQTLWDSALHGTVSWRLKKIENT